MKQQPPLSNNQTWRSPVSPTILITMREYFLPVVILQVPTFNFTKRLRIWVWNIFCGLRKVDQYGFKDSTFWFERHSQIRILPFNLEKEFLFHLCTGNFKINVIVASYVPWFVVPSSSLSFPHRARLKAYTNSEGPCARTAKASHG